MFYEVFNNWQKISFSQPMWLWLIPAIFLLIPLWKKLRPAVAHTNTRLHKSSLLSSWPGYLCMALLTLTWTALFCIPLAGPKMANQEMQQFLDARDFVIGIDRSGSMFSDDIPEPELRKQIDTFEKMEAEQELEMRKKYPGLYPYPAEDKAKTGRQPGEGKVMRFQLARYAAYQFVLSRPKGDRAGMFTFDDSGYWAWPLGSDLHIVLRQISAITKDSGGGTNFDGPTGPNGQKGAFQVTIDHFNEIGKAKTRVMIFISDGDAGISPQRHQELVAQMRQEGQEIHVFALVCGAKTQMDTATTKTLRNLVETVNPKDWKDKDGKPVDAVIWAGDGKSMANAFELISELEKSTIKLEPRDDSKPITRLFIILGAIVGGLFVTACVVFREAF